MTVKLEDTLSKHLKILYINSERLFEVSPLGVFQRTSTEEIHDQQDLTNGQSSSQTSTFQQELRLADTQKEQQNHKYVSGYK